MSYFRHVYAVAVREHIKCLVCGSQRPRSAFGIGRFDDYNSREAIAHDATVSLQTIGGRGRCVWDHQNLSPNLALALRARMKDALENLEQQMRDAGIRLEDDGA
jgi:hypothetical protein